MQELSLTQEYLLCVLRNKGKISSFDIEKGMCLTGACVLELLLDGIISWEEKDKLSLRTHLPDRMSYLRRSIPISSRSSLLNLKRLWNVILLLLRIRISMKSLTRSAIPGGSWLRRRRERRTFRRKDHLCSGRKGP